MTWMQLDHNHFDRPELFDVAAECPLAVLLDLRLRVWASAQATGGRITSGAVRMLAGTVGLTGDQADVAVGVLVDAGMWLVLDGGGWLLADHELVAQRDQARVASRAAAAARAAKSRAGTGVEQGRFDLPVEDENQMSASRARHARGVRARHAPREEKRREEGTTPPTPSHDVRIDADHDVGPADAGRARRDLDDLEAALIAAELGDPHVRAPSAVAKACRTAASELAALGATPTLIAAAAAEYRRRWPDITLTARALTRHWHTLTAPPPTESPAAPSADELAARRANALATNLARVPSITLTELHDQLASAGLAAHTATATITWHQHRRSAA